MSESVENLDNLLSRPKLSTFRTDCYFENSTKSWVPEDELESVSDTVKAYFILNKAPTGSARCRFCGQIISKFDLRIGYPITDVRGKYGILTAWVHINCSRSSINKALADQSEINIDDYKSYLKKLTDLNIPATAATISEVKKKKNPKKKNGSESAKGSENVDSSKAAFDKLSDSIEIAESEFRGKAKEGLTDMIPELKDLIDFLKVYCLNWEIADLYWQSVVVKFILEGDTDKEGSSLVSETISNLIKRERLNVSYPQPADLTANLLPYQLEGLNWMIEQEMSCIKGGILADEMGMGKTIQMIALLLSRKIIFDEAPVKASVDASVEAPVETPLEAPKISSSVEDAHIRVTIPQAVKSKYNIGATLIVAPLAAVIQWKQEIEKFTTPDSMKVLVYYGSCRAALSKEIHKYDVVITSYQSLENDYRRILQVYKIPCQYCGRMFLQDKLKFHQQYYCGPLAVRTDRQAKKEKKTAESTRKALKTLDITKNDPEDTTEGSPQKKSKKKKSSKKQPPEKKSDDNSYKPPTIINTYREIMKEANLDVNPAHHVSWLNPQFAKQYHAERQKELLQTVMLAKKLKNAAHSMSNDFTQNQQNVELQLDACQDEHLDPAELPTKAEMAIIFRKLVPLSKSELQKQKVSELQKFLKRLNQSTYGNKIELVNRLILLLYPEAEDLNETVSLTDPSTSAAMTIIEAPSSTKKPEKPENKKKELRVKAEKSPKKKKKQDVEPLLAHRPLRKRKKLYDLTETKLTSSSESVESDVIVTDDDDDESVCVVTEDESADFSLPESAPASDESEEESDPEEELESKEESDVLDSGFIIHSRESKNKMKEQAKKYKPAEVIKTGDETFDKILYDMENIPYLKYSPLHSVIWTRIVLDEAHRIKSRTTSTAKAVYDLKSFNSKWCLTGTPLQNRVGEMYSLIRFLEFSPFAFYFCSKKDCNCKSLQYIFVDNKYCVECNHSKMAHYSYFNKYIMNPIKNYGFNMEGKIALNLLKSSILDNILLRRTKMQRSQDINLPPMTVIIRRDKLSDPERDFYNSLYKKTRVEFDTYIDNNTLLHNYAHIFDLLSRLRQAVNHPYLIIYNLNFMNDELKNSSMKMASTKFICGLCQDTIMNKNHLVISGCKHSFHVGCIKPYIESAPITENQQVGCPVCYVTLTVDFSQVKEDEDSDSTEEDYESEQPQSKRVKKDEKVKPEKIKVKKEVIDDENESGTLAPQPIIINTKAQDIKIPTSSTGILNRIQASEFKSSTKMEALVQELTIISEKTPDDKSIVFSQYTSFLDLIEWRLKKGGFACAKLVGSLSLQARTNILYAFNTDPNLKIVLISLKAGGEGLNLQIANNIFLMDPWWNPAAELQAIQRAHRIGQKKPVRAVRFICEETIEEKMLQLQEKKQLVFDGTIGANDAAMTKLTGDDLKFLFSS